MPHHKSKSQSKSSCKRNRDRSRSRSRSSSAYRSRSHKSSSDSRNRDRSRDNKRDNSPRYRYKRSPSPHSRDRFKRDNKRSSSSSSRESTNSNRSSSSSSRSSVPKSVPVAKKSVDLLSNKKFDSVNNIDCTDKASVLNLLNADEFVPRTFTSTNKSKKENIIIDLNAQTISVPKNEADKTDKAPTSDEDPLIHPNFFSDESTRISKWVKKLFSYRQKNIMLKN